MWTVKFMKFLHFSQNQIFSIFSPAPGSDQISACVIPAGRESSDILTLSAGLTFRFAADGYTSSINCPSCDNRRGSETRNGFIENRLSTTDLLCDTLKI
jgi:hypothetical protein